MSGFDSLPRYHSLTASIPLLSMPRLPAASAPGGIACYKCLHHGQYPNAGLRRFFRILILLAAAAAFAVFGIESIRHYLDYLHAVGERGGQDIMRGVQQKATLTYWLFWSALAALSLLLVASKRTAWVAYFLCLAILTEGAAQGFFVAGHGHLYQPLPAISYAMFDPNPVTLASPHPGTFVDGLSHDADHRRTTVNEGKVADPKLIYVFGGSTTYDVGNRDSDTWPSQLSRLLGSAYAVENYGVPGFSSMEALAQSLFAFRDAHVSCAVYYEGWNDLRNAHIAGLQSDYSDYEIPYLNRALLLQSKPDSCSATAWRSPMALPSWRLPRSSRRGRSPPKRTRGYRRSTKTPSGCSPPLGTASALRWSSFRRS